MGKTPKLRPRSSDESPVPSVSHRAATAAARATHVLDEAHVLQSRDDESTPENLPWAPKGTKRGNVQTCHTHDT